MNAPEDIDDADVAAAWRRHRDSIDNFDAMWVRLFAERFKVTDAVGRLKAAHGIDASDPTREAAQKQRIAALAREAGLDPDFAVRLLELAIDTTIANHDRLRAEHESRDAPTGAPAGT